MANEDLSRLKIDRGVAAGITSHRKRPRLISTLAVIAALGLLVIFYFHIGTAVEVESATVTTAYPSQAFTLLNATGYVVAQRQAAVASKATGQVEWLGVTEGSRVTEGEIIARLENGDVSAAMEQGAGRADRCRGSAQP